MLKRLLNHFRKKRSDALIHQARDAAARASALLAEAILSRDPQELLDEDDEEDKIRSEQRRGEFTEAARRLFPDARTPVELAFAEALAARIAGGVRLPTRYLFEPKWIRHNLDELFTLFAEDRALDFVHLRRTGRIVDRLQDIDTDVLLFEVVAWFLAGLESMVRTSPSIPDRARVLPILSVGASIDRIGLIFERDGRFRTATNLLRTRIASYQREGAQSHLEFFLAAVGENRGRREPAEMIKGAFVMPTWDEGMFSTSVFGDSAISQGTALSTLVGFVEKAMQGYV